ncbi:hypothetical protein [Nocardia alni]|uniref:hypothetical protein n=1 Tax=Nocardia alni TaxID=2815723 RepID=UPI0020B3EA70|nr:hypothetical protein [Nocardia alni]
MILVPGRTPALVSARRRHAAARVRGGSAGAVSGALAIAAHGWTAQGMPVRSSTLILLVGVCAVVGALVTGLRPLRTTRLGLAVALVGGQVLGHCALAIDMVGMMHERSMWSSEMLGAHIAAALVAAVVIQGAEAAYRELCSVLSRMLPILVRPPAIQSASSLRITHRDNIVQRILATDSLRTRGPPLLTPA